MKMGRTNIGSHVNIFVGSKRVTNTTYASQKRRESSTSPVSKHISGAGPLACFLWIRICSSGTPFLALLPSGASRSRPEMSPLQWIFLTSGWRASASATGGQKDEEEGRTGQEEGRSKKTVVEERGRRRRPETRMYEYTKS